MLTEEDLTILTPEQIDRIIETCKRAIMAAGKVFGYDQYYENVDDINNALVRFGYVNVHEILFHFRPAVANEPDIMCEISIDKKAVGISKQNRLFDGTMWSAEVPVVLMSVLYALAGTNARPETLESARVQAWAVEEVLDDLSAPAVNSDNGIVITIENGNFEFIEGLPDLTRVTVVDVDDQRIDSELPPGKAKWRKSVKSVYTYHEDVGELRANETSYLSEALHKPKAGE